MKQLAFEQFLPISLEQAWSFFSNPNNLNLITPDKMHFNTITEVPDRMHEGLIIRYKIKPMMQLPMHWVTRISRVEDMVSFTDMQLKGPYRTWIHEHHFERRDGGVLMTDKLTYDIGMGFIGRLAGALWVDKKIAEIFDFRQKKLEELFPGVMQEMPPIVGLVDSKQSGLS